VAAQPLRPRAGREALGGHYEAVPPHLREPLLHWLDTDIRDASGRSDWLLLQLATKLRISLRRGSRGNKLFYDIRKHCEDLDGEEFLDVVHYLIQIARDSPYELWPRYYHQVESILVLGDSAWTATPDGLIRRIDPTAQAAFDQASEPESSASDELKEAWIKANGREPDYSDAWDHAIKAVEAVLIDTVIPKQNKPTLSHVVRHLETPGHLWNLLLPGPNDDFGVEPLVRMLQLLWPNPDRHGNPQKRPQPTLEEARAVVQLGVTIVQWGRDGHIVKKSGP
jgi:hypothetical protein